MRFATDATLGKLGRHLRAAGFDTVCQHETRSGHFFNAIAPDRIVLTRTGRLVTRLKHHTIVFIRDNDPFRQMVQVFRELNIGPSDLNPFSRCLICNLEIVPAGKPTVKGKVPAYIWQHHQSFGICPGCERIYWSGSHHRRLTRRYDILFKHKGSLSSHERQTTSPEKSMQCKGESRFPGSEYQCDPIGNKK